MLRPFAGSCSLLLLLAFTASASAQTVQFTFQNADGAGEGFNDPTFGAQRQFAMNYVMSRLSTFFQARYVGETVVVRAEFNLLGGSGTSAVLGQAGTDDLRQPANAVVASRWHANSLANHRNLSDMNGGTQEINAIFNGSVDNGTVLGATNWYYGTNALPGIHIDFATVALHEVGHGLGFFSVMNANGSYLSPPVVNQLPSIYDEFMNSSNVGGTHLTSLGGFSGGGNATRAAERIGDDLWWDGAFGTAGNGGIRPRLYAPNPFEGGSSLSHTNEATYPNGLMTPEYDSATHTFSAMEFGMLRDMGWTLAAVPEPSTFALIGLAVGGVAYYRRRRQTTIPLAAADFEEADGDK